MSKIQNVNIEFSFPRKIKKLKLKINNKSILNKLKTKNIPEENVSIADHKQINQEIRTALKDKCLKINYLTKKMMDYFPKNTITFNFTKKISECNYYLLIYILKTYNNELFGNFKIKDIKDLLIKYYKPYFENNSFIKQIFNKWIIQGKSNFIKDFYRKNVNIDTIINDELYFLSEIDILLIAYNMKIPIIVYYHSKTNQGENDKNIKLINFTKPSEKQNYFFVKSSFIKIPDDKTNKKHNILYLTQHNKKLYLPFNILKEPLKKEINNVIFSSMNEYLNKKIKKNEPIKFNMKKYKSETKKQESKVEEINSETKVETKKQESKVEEINSEINAELKAESKSQKKKKKIIILLMKI